jgi:predicted MFS family arabinose efflux permease
VSAAPGQPSEQVARAGWPKQLGRWRALGRSARLYLLHAGLLTSCLAITTLFFNLTILELGFSLRFLGLLNMLSVGVAAALSLPLWWLATRAGLRQTLIGSAVLQALNAFSVAIWPQALPLLLATAGTGIAAVLFQVTAAPFMMRHSDDQTRDALFSANAALNVGLAGVGSLIGGYLPTLLGAQLGFSAASAPAYRATFALAGLGLLLSILPLLLIREAVADPARAREAASPLAGSQAPPPYPWLPEWVARRLARIPEPWSGMLRRPWSLIQLLIPPALISLGAALLIPYLNLFFKQRFDSPDATLGAIFATLGIVTGLAALAAPALAARLGKPRTVAFAQLLSIPFLLVLGFAPLLWLAVSAALVRGALFNLGSPLYDALAMERSAPAERPTVIGLINAAYAAGYIVAPPISVAVQERAGFGPLFVATALCYTLAAFATYRFFLREA